MSKLQHFRPHHPGLQIIWNDKDSEWSELEFIDLERPGKPPKQTVAELIWGRQRKVYRYPMEWQRTGDTITLTYRDNPPEWKGKEGWHIIRGTLTIVLGRDGVPRTVNWDNEPEAREYVLKRGEDWEFFPRIDVKSDDLPPVRGRVTTTRAERPEQALMRKMLLEQFSSCMLTGCPVVACLEACHLLPVKNRGVELVDNMILLRADLHRLFDANLLSIHPSAGGVVLKAHESVVSYLEGVLPQTFFLDRETWAPRAKWLEARASISNLADHVTFASSRNKFAA
jgi:hypothetical protein